MRKIYILRGVQGSGKSTFIRENQLELYTVSSDGLRVLFGTVAYDLSGSPIIPQSNDKIVWDTLRQVVRTRMENGAVIFVDATHCLARDISKYAELAKEFFYDLKVVDFEVPLEELLKRNSERPPIQRVKEEIIKLFYDRKKDGDMSNYVVIKPGQVMDDLCYRTTFCNLYEKLIFIGDTQGCFEALDNYFKENPYNPNFLYIFTGDYLDRGIQNGELMEFILEFSKKENVVFIKGNHERHLERWSQGLQSYSNIFNTKTAPQLEERGISQDAVYEFCGKLQDYLKLSFNGRLYTVTHGGIPFSPNAITAKWIPSGQYVNGIGGYEDDIDALWNERAHDNEYQVHGHRNSTRSPIINKNSINLEGGVEFGGSLRIAEVDVNGIKPLKYKQTIIDEEIKRTMVSKKPVSSGSFLKDLRSNPLIKEKDLGGNVSSFNFTREAFYGKKWDETNIKARGLFIDTATEKIVARSYEKFFNLGEREDTKIGHLQKSLKFPVTVYQKDNGFLGILGFHDGELFFASKSSNQTDFANWFKEIAEATLDMAYLKELMKSGNFSMVFEVNDPVNDPHIIKYKERHLVLLDVIYNTEEFRKLSYDNLIGIAKKLGCQCKIKTKVITSWYEFMSWYQQVNIAENEIEGYVVEDHSGFMFKIKLPFYSFWKGIRTYRDRIKAGKPINTRNTFEEFSDVLEWMLTLKPENLNKDIITLREMYFNRKKAA